MSHPTNHQDEFDFLSDSTEQTSTRFVCFITPGLKRFDLAITTTNHFYGKQLVTDLQSGRTALIGPDDLELEGYLAYVYQLKEEDARELESFLWLTVGMVHYPHD